MSRTSLAASVVGLLIAGLPGHAHATALDADSCAKLKTTLEELEKGGARNSFAKGPQWAKANLPPDKLQDVRRLIETDEQLLFRCPGRHLVNLPLEPDPPPPPPVEDKKPDADAKAELPKPVPPAEPKGSDKAKAQPQKKTPPQAKAAAVAEPQKQPKPQPKAQPAAKPRQKPVDDAFRPPPSSNPESSFGLN